MAYLIKFLLLCLLAGNAFAIQTTPTSDFIDNNDGTVTHKTTGLTWMRCALGQTWTGSSCKGTAKSYTYTAALKLTSRFAGHSDWRLPNIAELQTIVERDAISPAINTELFPSTPSDAFWSSSPYVGYSNYAWYVYFSNGYVYLNNNRNNGFAVRLVRASQSLVIGLADLSTTIAASTDHVGLNQAITYTATLSNNGTAAASNAILIFKLPSGSHVVSVPSDCASNGTSTHCTVPSLAAGASITKAITVSYAQRGALNIISLGITDSDDSDPTNNQSQVMTTITL